MITPLYAALLGLLLIILSVRVILLRKRFLVAVGDGENAFLRRAIRVHANLIEYAPLTLLLLFFFEVLTANVMLVHGLGAALFIGRLLHAYGVSQVNEKLIFRQLGLGLNFIVLFILSFYILYYYVVHSFFI